MTEEQIAAADKIKEIILGFPWHQRGDIFEHVQFNDIFCVHCGFGERDKPNVYCQCTNDE